MRYWKTAVGLMMALLFLLTGCGSSSAASSGVERAVEEGTTVQGDMDTVPEQKTEALQAYQEPADQTNPSDPVSLDCSFTLEGKEYTLPVDFSVLEADGWDPAVDPDKEINDRTYTIIYMKKPDKEKDILFLLLNDSGNKAKVKDCKLVSIDIYKSTLDEYSFALSNGLKPGDDKETVESLMGTPTHTSETDKYVSFVYGAGRETGKIKFVWWKEEELREQGHDVVTIECFK